MPITAGLAQPRPVEGAATTITAPECPATTTAPTKRIGAHIDPLPKYYDDVVLSSLYVYVLGPLRVCCNATQRYRWYVLYTIY